MGRVMYNQPGYVGCSMSVRAAMAYSNGEMPKSRWTKQMMLCAIKDYCDDFGMEYSRPHLTKDELFKKFFEWKSWHHTGKYGNQTDFYGLDEEAVCKEYGEEK